MWFILIAAAIITIAIILDWRDGRPSAAPKARGFWSLKTKCNCKCPVCRKRDELRKLFQEHSWWTRQVVVSAGAKLPDLDAAVKRLKDNQTDIALAIGGTDEAVVQVQKRLWDEHIDVAIAVVGAATAAYQNPSSMLLTSWTDDPSVQTELAKWKLNASEIAFALTALRPKHLTYAATNDMMQMHLTTLLTDVVARIESRWDDDVVAMQAVEDHILNMADALAVAFAS